MGALRKPFKSFLQVFRVLGNAGYKFYWDDCFSRAASLAYTTLFALVPVAAISFSLFSAFGVAEPEVESYVQRLLAQILPPNENELLVNLKSQVYEYLSHFGSTVRSLGAVSIGVLIFTGIALLNTIESALNAVWRVTSDLSIFAKITNFWAVITGGPLLFVFSVYWYTNVGYVEAQTLPWVGTFVPLMDVIIPTAAIWFALTLMFYKLPATRVALRDAAFGAFVAAIVFEFVKRGFAYYISVSTTYSKFYGVLTTIPLFLFWLYLTWVVILLGAEISYQAGSTQVLSGLRKYRTELGEVGAMLGLRILYVIGEKFYEGVAAPSDQEIAIATGSDPVLVRSCLDVLTDAEIITSSDGKNSMRSLVKSPERLSISDVFDAFHTKSYLARAGDDYTHENSRELQFLEAVRELSNKTNCQANLGDWTLAEIITTTPKKECV